MRTIRKSIIVLCFASILFPGCAFPLFNSSAYSSPTLGSEPGVPTSVVLFSDNFDTGRGNWSLISSNLGSRIAYEHKGLRVTINEINYGYWTSPGKQFGDMRVAVSASRLGGPNDNYFGVICRFQLPDSFYGFLVSSDGYYGIIKVTGGQFQILDSQSMEYSEVIVKDRATNRVRGDCIGNSLTLFVNGVLLKTVEDSEFRTGDAGLIAGSHEIWAVDILFDDFIVYQP
jgi:hypothetical protein